MYRKTCQKSDEQARDVPGHVLYTDSFKFFRISLDKTNLTIANTYFLVPFYCSRQLIHCLKISGNKNNLRTI